jgi:hypothetical protein
MCFWFYTLSRLCASGFPGRELTNHHLHLYIHIMSPTDHRSFAYFANFMDAGSRTSVIGLWCPVFGVYILHPKLRCSTIRPQSPRTCKPDSTYDDSVCPTCLSILSQVFKVSRVHALPSSEKFKSIFCSPPSPPPSTLPNAH